MQRRKLEHQRQEDFAILGICEGGRQWQPMYSISLYQSPGWRRVCPLSHHLFIEKRNCSLQAVLANGLR